MIDDADLDPTLLADRRWLLLLGAIALLACGSGPARDSGARATTPPSEPPAASPTEPATPPAPIAANDAAREWIRAAPGRAAATLELVERDAAPASSDEPTLRVIAHDGPLTLDAWVPANLRPSADAYWLVAELVSIARSAAIDDLVRAEGWTLWTIAGRSMLCREPTGACYALPEQRRVQGFFCQPGHRRCTMFAETEDGRVAEWGIDATPSGMHRRRVRSWPAIAAPLEGRWDAGARAERGPRERLAPMERPAIANDPALEQRGGSDPESDPNGLGEDPCTPTVRSFRRGELVVRSVGCEGDPLSITGWPAAFVVTRGDRTETTPLFLPSPGPPEPLRPFDVSVLAGGGAIGFVADASDGGSPGGFSSEDLWVLVPAAGPRGARLHSLPLGAWSTEGYGNEDEREGYVVGIDRSRSTFEVTGPGAGRFVACERWIGTHARRSDRWRGEHRAARLDLPVTFDPDRGFEIREEDRERRPCASDDSESPSDG